MKSKKKMKYLIVSPRQHCGGGCIVLHRLSKELADMGYDARVWECDVKCNKKAFFHPVKFWIDYVISEAKYLRVWTKIRLKELVNYVLPAGRKFDLDVYDWLTYKPVQNYKKVFLPIVSRDTIVVYPEVFFGNILGAKKVVRWLLGHTDMYEHEHSFDEGDLFFAYREVFDNPKRNPEGRKCIIRHYNLDLYKQTNFGVRKGNCYIIRKGANRKDLPKKFDGPIIDGMTEKKIVELFNQCERVYSYDMQTGYSSIAALCGAISIVVPEGGAILNDYYSGYEEIYGIAFGDCPEEINRAIASLPQIKKWFSDIDVKNRVNAEFFVKECETYFDCKQIWKA